jgi:predicted PurR-regulated permease PerM
VEKSRPLEHPAEQHVDQTVRIRLPAGEVFRSALVLLAIGLGAYVLWRLRDLLFLLVLGILFATAIEPAVERLRRGPFTRGSGTLAVFLAIALAIAVPAYLLFPMVNAQAQTATANLPERVAALRPMAEQLPVGFLRDAAVNGVEYGTQVFKSPEAPRVEEVAEASTTAFNGLIGVMTVFVVAFYWTVERAQMRRTLREATPTRARDVNVVWVEIEERLGGWVRGQMMLVAIVGTVAAIGYTLIGLPAPLLLAIFAGLGELVPVIGPFLGFAPAVVMGLTVGPETALITLVFALVVQQVEGYILVPKLVGESTGVSPLTVLLGILAGYGLLGVPGALLAVPIAAAGQVVVQHALGLDRKIEQKLPEVQEEKELTDEVEEDEDEDDAVDSDEATASAPATSKAESVGPRPAVRR